MPTVTTVAYHPLDSLDNPSVMDSPGESQVELDARIYVLELELAHLKQRRNTLSAISRLPPEITCNIFVSSVPSIEDDDSMEHTRHQAITISHVSHAWRDTAIACPELWSILQVGVHTPEEMLNLTLERSQQAPISLRFRGFDIDYHNPAPSEALISALSDMVRAGSARVREMALRKIRDDSLQTLFNGVIGSFTQLVYLSLTIMVTNHGEDHILETLNHASFPCLQHLNVDYPIPAGHALLQSSRLTDIRIYSLLPAATTFSDLLSLMKRSNSLRRFRIDRFCSTTVLPTFDFSSAKGDNAVGLPNLELFECHSPTPDIILHLLSSVRIPIRCRIRVSANATRIMSAVYGTFGNPAPFALRIRDNWVDAWDKYSDTGRFDMEHRWMGIRHSHGCLLNVWEWGWSFTNLAILSVGFDLHYPGHNSTFWKLLAESSTSLESLAINSRCVKHAAIGDFMNWLSGRDRIAGSDTLAWPLLEQLFLPLPKEYGYVYRTTRKDDTTPPMHHQVEFALDLVDALKAREIAGSGSGVRRLTLLKIKTPFDIPLDEDTSRIISNRLPLFAASGTLDHHDSLSPITLVSLDNFALMDSPGESQAELDARIYVLELELAHLKQRRNTLSPISRLPPEIFCKIFVSSVPGLDEEGLTWRLRLQAMQLSHVSHIWRATAINCSGLWGILHIGDCTSEEILNLALERAQRAPILLNICNFEPYRRTATPSEAVISALATVLKTRSAQFRELALSVRKECFRSLLNGSTGSFDQLVSLKLEVVGEPLAYDTILEEFLQCAFPQLRHLDIDPFIPANHVILQSSHLTNVSLYCLLATATTFSDLLRLTRRSTNLRRFVVYGVSWNGGVPTIDFSLAKGDNAVYLPRLEVLEFHSSIPDMVLHFLSSITIPVRCRLKVSANDARIMSTVKRTFGNPAPVALRTRANWVDAWDEHSDFGRMKRDQLWIEIRHSQGCMANLWEWGWSFANLCVISIGSFDNPGQGVAFWHFLAESAIALQSIIISARCVTRAAIECLMGWLSGRVRIAGSQKLLAWPTLGQLFLSLPTEYEYTRTRGDDDSPPGHHQVEFALDLVDALLARGIVGSELGVERLKLLRFKTPFEPPLDEDTFRLLSGVAEDVVVAATH
ncbi:hypothetical protein NMY22_g5362 [Coprinellus aureogranulatus]|nr:hypothetical protein NMY22_g5362 [Coprinellus aureogranulatus]